jgi:hypothetical protein
VGKGAATLRIVADVEEASSYEWRLNGVTVANATGASRVITGAGSPELCIKGATAADAGVYQLVARNASGTTVSLPVQVEMATPPVMVQAPVAPAGLKTGETLRLTAQVSGAGPLDYAWYKDGRLVLRSKAPVLEVSTIDGKASGNYTVVATNRYGSVTSPAVRVQTR